MRLFNALGPGLHEVRSPLDAVAGVLRTGDASARDVIGMLTCGVEIISVEKDG